jgi:FKBP-type peptidyl-prolyl cis-trans isomerase (trigger factor)
MFSRVFEIIAQDLIENGMVGMPVPQELAGDEFDVSYTSRVDSQVSGIETENLLYAITEMVQAEGQLSQTLHAKAFVNLKSILDNIAKRRNLSPAETRTNKEYQNELARIQQGAQEQMMQQADAQAAGNRDITKKPEDGSEADVVTRARAGQL